MKIRQHKQGGAALIISLIILLAMTLIGVSSMDSAVLELRMAGTMQSQVVAMNRAEATLAAAEDRIVRALPQKGYTRTCSTE